MRRAETMRAKNNNETPRTLLEFDYLLGINDEARQGALRFSIAPQNTDFLAKKSTSAIPILMDLPKLLSASERFQRIMKTPMI